MPSPASLVADLVGLIENDVTDFVKDSVIEALDSATQADTLDFSEQAGDLYYNVFPVQLPGLGAFSNLVVVTSVDFEDIGGSFVSRFTNLAESLAEPLSGPEELVGLADVNRSFPEDTVTSVIDRKESELLALYRQKHRLISEKTGQLQELVFDAGHWWLNSPEHEEALQQVRVFIDNIRHNFGDMSPAWRQIQSDRHRERRKNEIVDALMGYRAERDAWDRLFTND